MVYADYRFPCLGKLNKIILSDMGNKITVLLDMLASCFSTLPTYCYFFIINFEILCIVYAPSTPYVICILIQIK